MAITTYGELKIAVSNWLDQPALTHRIPEFIAMAEDEIALDPRIRLRAMETSTDLTVNAQTVALPSGYIEGRRLYLDGTPKKRVEFIAPEDFWVRNLANQTGLPKWFTIEGENLVFGPSPDQTYTGKFLFYQRFTALSADADTNWLLSNARGVLVYGALLQAIPFLADSPQAAAWAATYEREVDKMVRSDKRDRYSGAPLISRTDVQVW